MTEYDNNTVELFYWAPESVDMLRKQAHLMYKFLQMNAQYRTIYRYISGSDRNAQEIFLKTVLYSSTWDSRWFQADKSRKDWDNELDTWFYRQFDNTKLIRNWNQGIDYLEKNISPNLLSDKNSIGGRGLIIFESRHRIIGQLT
jgi:hypothetical protein